MPAMAGRLAFGAAAAALVLAPSLGGMELVIEAPAGFTAAAARIRQLDGTDLARVAELLGANAEIGSVRVILAEERSPLAARAPSWVSGYALPPLATVVLFPERVPSYPDRTLEALVVHELSHLLIAHAAGFRAMPRWFDEGLATVAAREWGIEDRARFAMAVIGPGPRSLGELEDGFVGDAPRAARAYAVSAALVRHLIRRFGPHFVATTLRAVAAGVPFDEAFHRSTGSSPAVAATLFFRRETFWNTWVPFLTSSTALWMGITVLTLLAIRARRRRDAEIRARWAEEERLATLRRPPGADEDSPVVN